MKLCLGVDLHKKSCWVTVMNAEGQVLDSQRMGTERGTLLSYFGKAEKPGLGSGGDVQLALLSRRRGTAGTGVAPGESVEDAGDPLAAKENVVVRDVPRKIALRQHVIICPVPVKLAVTLFDASPVAVVNVIG